MISQSKRTTKPKEIKTYECIYTDNNSAISDLVVFQDVDPPAGDLEVIAVAAPAAG